MIKNIVSIILFSLLIAVTGSNVIRNYYWDITDNRINDLALDTKEMLNRLDGPLSITFNTPNTQILTQLENIAQPLQRYSDMVNVDYVTTTNSETVDFYYKGKTRTFDLDIDGLNSNSFHVLLQEVLQHSDYWISFITGHGELDPFDTSSLGISQFANSLKESGIHISELNIAQLMDIPNNVNTLVIANPQMPFQEVEKKLIHKYIKENRNIWWFTEPGSPVADILKEEFGLYLTPGVIVDPSSLALGSPHPALKILTEYPEHVINTDLNTATVLPWSGNMNIVNPKNDWKYNSILATNDNAWTYTGHETVDLKVMSEHVDQTGSLNIAYSLTNHQQRIILLADSSFMLTKYYSMYANRKFLNNALQWIDAKPTQEIVATSTQADLSYYPSTTELFLFNYAWIFFVPLIMLTLGFCIRTR